MSPSCAYDLLMNMSTARPPDGVRPGRHPVPLEQFSFPNSSSPVEHQRGGIREGKYVLPEGYLLIHLFAT
jgi:hypothetical protein